MKFKLLLIIILIGGSYCKAAATKPGNPVYSLKNLSIEDVCFTPENFYINADSKSDVSDAIQKAINRINMDERPVSMANGGKENDMLFVTSSTSFNKVKIK